MPLFTPSRVAVAVLSLSLLSFLWTIGFPQPLAQPAQHAQHAQPALPALSALPVISHESSPGEPTTKPATEPLIPAPIVESISSKPATGSPKQGGETPTLTSTPTTLKKEVPKPSSSSSRSRSTSSTPTPAPTPVDPKKFCQDVRGAPDIMIIVKTSKAEMPDALPPALATLLSCVPNFAIFSDHAGKLGPHPVYDTLASIRNTTRAAHAEFAPYDLMAASPASHTPAPDSMGPLDKWKFLPLVYHAHRLSPTSKFYLVIEPDTTFVWTNLLQWIARLDPRIPYYSGAPTFVNDIKFAQRGPGILLSNGALRLYTKAYDERYETVWEPRVAKECCGDLVLATAMADAHVEFYSAFPMLQGEAPGTLDWTKRNWCSPVVSWHGVREEEGAGLWGAERNWTGKVGWGVPYLGRDAFRGFVEGGLEAVKEEWDNISSDTKVVGRQGWREEKEKQKVEAERKEKEEKERAEMERQRKEKEAKLAKEDEPTGDQKKAGDAAIAKPTSAPNARRETKEETIAWDKIAEQVKDAAESPERCKALCSRVEDCLQWKYTGKGDGECHLGKVLRLGRKAEHKEGENAERWTSGWMMEKVRKQTKEWDVECEEKGVNWRFNQ